MVLIVHDKKKERLVPDEKHPAILEYKVYWRKNCISVLNIQQWQKLIKQFPLLNTKAKIYYDLENRQYILSKDRRIPAIILNIRYPVLKRSLHRCEMKAIDTNNKWIPLSIHDVLQKQETLRT